MLLPKHNLYITQTREPKHQKCDKPIGTGGYYTRQCEAVCTGCMSMTTSVCIPGITSAGAKTVGAEPNVPAQVYQVPGTLILLLNYQGTDFGYDLVRGYDYRRLLCPARNQFALSRLH